MTDTRNKSYFTFPHPFWIGSISFGLWILVMSRFWPTSVPAIFGPVGRFATYVGVTYPRELNYLCIATLFIHVFEALLAVRICSKRNMEAMATVKWTTSTLFFGFASLIRLVPQKRLEFIPGSTKAKAAKTQ